MGHRTAMLSASTMLEKPIIKFARKKNSTILRPVVRHLPGAGTTSAFMRKPPLLVSMTKSRLQLRRRQEQTNTAVNRSSEASKESGAPPLVSTISYRLCPYTSARLVARVPQQWSLITKRYVFPGWNQYHYRWCNQWEG